MSMSARPVGTPDIPGSSACSDCERGVLIVLTTIPEESQNRADNGGRGTAVELTRLHEKPIAQRPRISGSLNRACGTGCAELTSMTADAMAPRAPTRRSSLPLRSDGNVQEESPLLHNVADSGNETVPGGNEAVPTKEALAPGHYVAVCNLPGHYHLGLWLNITVVR